ncbi:hypothetical protein AVEN_35269-1 [Araneus ventricosus]|uniref:Uncharacterized protein n=1 Tax=Araneus ventricosus TaxID=182803 RepID=A0A4Y2EH82_ARAVE|nr:hypothetical protein AVEN_35269-1 [Araneus ventricosus]
MTGWIGVLPKKVVVVVSYSTCSSPQLDQVQESARPNRRTTLDARGKKSDFVHCLYALAGYGGMAFTPWVTLPGEKIPDVHRPFHPRTPPPPRRGSIIGLGGSKEVYSACKL